VTGIACVLLVAVMAGGCTSGGDPARGVAERFLDDHYVRMDLTAALAHTTGLARHKVEEELRLVGDQEIDAATMQPSVTYELEEERPDGDERATFLYRGKVALSGGHSFSMRWLVSVRREESAWKVSNFKEMQ
jgi:hypothetical protein